MCDQSNILSYQQQYRTLSTLSSTVSPNSTPLGSSSAEIDFLDQSFHDSLQLCDSQSSLGSTSSSCRSSFCFPGSDDTCSVTDSQTSPSSPTSTTSSSSKKRVRILLEPAGCVTFECERVFKHAEALASKQRSTSTSSTCSSSPDCESCYDCEDLAHLEELLENTIKNSRPGDDADIQCRISLFDQKVALLERKMYLSCFKCFEEIMGHAHSHVIEALEPVMQAEKNWTYKSYQPLFEPFSANIDLWSDILDFFSPDLDDSEDDDDWGSD